MNIRSVPIPNARLEEGRVYPFKIVKTVSLGPGDDWFIMRDPNGFKTLLPRVYYEEYGLEPGKEVLCRVDKINCNGRMFLEPMHPHYREGEVYSFDVISREHRINILGEEEYFFIVRDIFNQHRRVRTYNKARWESPPGHLRCLLKRIKKGQLFLVIEDEAFQPSKLHPGKQYDFILEGEKMHPDDGQTYYILIDPYGEKHLLKKKHFARYGFQAGQKIRCRVDKFSTEGYFFLEPEHPCYEKGKIYEFPLDRLEELVFTDGSRQPVMILTDCFGEDVKLFLDRETLLRYAGHRLLQAQVKDIRKGRLEVELTDHQPN
ncbi:MAG: hypothetical protein ACLFN2_00170 [Bacteroidales bacterium]